MWYRVVYIGGIGVFLEVLSQWHKRNIWFLHFRFFHFLLVIWTFFCSIFKCKFSFQISNGNFVSNLKKLNFQIFSFQISKMISKIFIQFFVTYFNFFHFPLVLWQLFSTFNSNFKIDFFQNFHFPLVVGPKFSIQISKTKKSFQIFLWHKWIFFLGLRL
jgi:hypothetical protein